MQVLMLIILDIVLFGCGMPRDPNHTLERVQGGVIRVGVAENPPWVKRMNGLPEGIEIDLVQEFAETLNAKIQWMWGPEFEHMESLKHFELDLFVGGLTQSHPSRKRVGFTSPYFIERVAIGAPQAMIPVRSLKGLPVVTAEKGKIIAELKKKGAEPMRLERLARLDSVTAAPVWELEKLGFEVTETVLQKRKHIIAAPPGENAWIGRLERFLYDHCAQIEVRLKQEQ